MSHPYDDLNTALSLSSTYGNAPRCAYLYTVATTTAIGTASGYATWQQYNGVPPVPAYASPVTGYILSYFNAYSTSAISEAVFGLRYTLGQLTLNGGAGTSANLAAMPTKTPYAGTSGQTSTPFIFLVVTTVLSATTPAITVTYKNQNGTGSRTATITPTTNAAVNTVFPLWPYLQSGDKGVQEITAISSSGGASGVIQLYGVLPLALDHGGANMTSQYPNYIKPFPVWTATSTDTLCYFRSGVSGAQHGIADLEFVPTTT